MELSFRIKKTPDFIFDYLTDMQKFVSIHPVITKIEKRVDESYLVYETLKLGFIPFSFTYPVKIEKDINTKLVVMRATVFRLTKIEMTFKLKEDGDHTIIEDTIVFRSPLPVKSIMQKIFRNQHGQLFRNMELT